MFKNNILFLNFCLLTTKKHNNTLGFQPMISALSENMCFYHLTNSGALSNEMPRHLQYVGCRNEELITFGSIKEYSSSRHEAFNMYTVFHCSLNTMQYKLNRLKQVQKKGRKVLVLLQNRESHYI